MSFTGRVVIVTGAGGGLGRAYAHLLGAHGAHVVVCDRGVALDGAGGDGALAEQVASEILDAGGEATAVACDVTSSEEMVGLAQSTFRRLGRIDALIANAGILRDRSFAKMSSSDFEAVIDIHLLGTANAALAVWPMMREAGYGRLVFTTSHAGLFGNFGQANYAAGKMGVIGLMQVLKLEGAKSGIAVNAIAPLAMTRMAEGTPLSRFADDLSVERVAPVAVYLASDTCESTGLIVGAGRGGLQRIELSVAGHARLVSPRPSVEEVAAAWPTLLGSNERTRPSNAAEALAILGEAGR